MERHSHTAHYFSRKMLYSAHTTLGLALKWPFSPRPNMTGPTLTLLFPQFWEITPRLTAHQGPATAYCIQFPGNRSSKGQAEKQLDFQIRGDDLSVCKVSQIQVLGPSAGHLNDRIQGCQQTKTRHRFTLQVAFLIRSAQIFGGWAAIEHGFA